MMSSAASFTPDLLESMGLARPASVSSGRRDELGQSEFLKLMTVQLANQDPMKPMENGEFIGQMAQFSTVTGIESLTRSFEQLAASLSQGQALQAATLVGRDVLVPMSYHQLTEGVPIRGAVDVPQDMGIMVSIHDTSGQLVRQIELEPGRAGLRDFEWDGLLADGTPAPEEIYEFRAVAVGGAGGQVADMFLESRVESVAVEPNGGLRLAVHGLGPIDFSLIRRVS